MATFDETYYLQSKLAQLHAQKEVDSDGNAYTEETLRQAIADVGLTVEEHYRLFSLDEGTSANPYFNTSEYLKAKVAQLNSTAYRDKTDWTVDDVITAFHDNGFQTAEEHYAQHGCTETDAQGHLINPSNAFDANAYVAAKLAQLEKIDYGTYRSMNASDVATTIQNAGMTPVSHYEQYGKAEEQGMYVAMLQTVPVVDRVLNDPFRDAMDENVPSNYNASTAAPGTVRWGAAVTKPADMADLTDADKPDDPVATVCDVPYVPVPGGGVADTNGKPAALFTASAIDACGKEVSFSQYGAFDSAAGEKAYGIDATGATTGDVVYSQTVNDDDMTVTTTTVTQDSSTITSVQQDDGYGNVTTSVTASLYGGANNTEQTITRVKSANGDTTTESLSTVTNDKGKLLITLNTTETARADGASTSTTFEKKVYFTNGKLAQTETGSIAKSQADGTETTITRKTIADYNDKTTGTTFLREDVSSDDAGVQTTKTVYQERDSSGDITLANVLTAVESRDGDGVLTSVVTGTRKDADGNVTRVHETTQTTVDDSTGVETRRTTVDNTVWNSDGEQTGTQKGTVICTIQADSTAERVENIVFRDMDGNTSRSISNYAYDPENAETLITGRDVDSSSKGETTTTTRPQDDINGDDATTTLYTQPVDPRHDTSGGGGGDGGGGVTPTQQKGWTLSTVDGSPYDGEADADVDLNGKGSGKNTVNMRPLHKSGYDILFCCCGDF